MIGLYPGFFQPPHIGHFRCIELIKHYCDVVVIGLRPMDDMQASFLCLNQRMIIFQRTDLQGCLCLPLVRATDFDIVFTGNPALKHHYEDQGFPVVPLPQFKVTGNEIRQRLGVGASIKGLVYPGSEGLIKACFDAYLERNLP